MHGACGLLQAPLAPFVSRGLGGGVGVNVQNTRVVVFLTKRPPHVVCGYLFFRKKQTLDVFFVLNQAEVWHAKPWEKSKSSTKKHPTIKRSHHFFFFGGGAGFCM